MSRNPCYKEQTRICIQILRRMLNWADRKTVCRAVSVLNTNWKTGTHSCWRDLVKVLFQNPCTWLLGWFLSHYGNPLVSICCIPEIILESHSYSSFELRWWASWARTATITDRLIFLHYFCKTGNLWINRLPLSCITLIFSKALS